MARAQITILVILGIVILTVVVGTLYLRGAILKSEFDRELEKAALVPEKIKPAKILLDNCVAEISQEALTLIGLQGGYINLPVDEQPTTINDPFSNRLRLDDESSFSVGYWGYETSNGVRKTQIPSLDDIEESVEEYISNNFDRCVDDLVFLEAEGYEIEKSETKEVRVTILDDNVQVIVDYPVNIKFENIEFAIDRHLANIFVSLGNFYNVARQIFDKEESEFFLEDKTIDMMSVYDEIPLSGTEFDCKPRLWTKNKVVSDFKKIVSDNIKAIRIKNSLNENIDYYNVDVNANFNDARVDFSYIESWPFIVNIAPDNEVLTADFINDDFGNDVNAFITSLFCMQNYDFVYDVKYPVLISISYDQYLFQFAEQVVIKNNEPRERNPELVDLEDSESDICKNKITEVNVNTFAINQDESLSILNDVGISYQCLNVICPIGKTVNGALKEKFPLCINGFIVAEKDGYGKTKELLSTNLAGDLAIALEKNYELDLDVKLIDKKTGEIRNTYESEQIVLTFKTDNYGTTLIYPETKKVSLVPGDYEVNSYILGESTFDIQIQEQRIEKCVEEPRAVFNIFGNREETCVETTIPGTSLEQVVKGGAEFRFSVDRRELGSANKIIVYTIVDEFPGTYESLANVYSNIATNNQLSIFRLPRLE